MILVQLVMLFITLSAADKFNEDLYNIHFQSEDAEASIRVREWEKIILKERENFTTCAEFLNNTKLDINKLLDVEWTVFYYWVDSIKSIDSEPVFIKLSVPDKTLLDRFKYTAGEETKAVNWTAAEIFMVTNTDLNGLLFATNQSGLFKAVVIRGFQEMLQGPDDFQMALKFIEPNYLGLMNCQLRVLVGFAPIGKVPNETEAETVAKQFNFKSDAKVAYSVLMKARNDMLANSTQRPTNFDDSRELDLQYNEVADDQKLSVL